MIIGAMNHPQRDVISEIHDFAEMGMQFVDLTLEPPAAASWKVDPKAIRKALDDTGLDVIGHTAYYLPIESPMEEIRAAAVEELKRCLRIFGEVGARWMNIHPGRHAPMHDRAFIIKQNLKSLRELLPVSLDVGVGLMIENLPGSFNTASELGELLDPMPELGLHVDIGHSNLMVEHNTMGELAVKYGHRIKHVHLHDNKGGSADLHMPIGSGTMDCRTQLKHLKRTGYDGTITLEVFTEDKHFVTYSRDVLRRMWDEL